MALCFDGTLEKLGLSGAELTALLLSVSLSGRVSDCVASCADISCGLSASGGPDAVMSLERPLSFDVRDGSGVVAAFSAGGIADAGLSGVGAVGVGLSGNGVSVGMTSCMMPVASLRDGGSVDVSMRSEISDSYLSLFCPVDYLVSCFSDGWNNDLGWNNDEGWDND